MYLYLKSPKLILILGQNEKVNFNPFSFAVRAISTAKRLALIPIYIYQVIWLLFSSWVSTGAEALEARNIPGI